MPLIPEVIETRRLFLRAWRRDDAPVLKAAIDANLERLQQWMPWAMDEPSSLDVIRERLDAFHASFLSDEAWLFGILDRADESLIGGIGLHRRTTAATLEIGYWAQSHATGRGVVTEAVSALTDAAFGVPGVEAVEIRCDPANERSAAVPRRLGFILRETLVGDARTPAGAPRDTMVFECRRTTS